ncbi:winged helix-turn-helix transcriptional regulator [Cumulibacter manganitolerans]|uniref:winged helix-turn-helix transcriptional regulator n=1 Tax=Cumulibacter manganitolerans TaxID=1884992 RepID=UPI001296D8AA|nr:helix-turn-helix domain-containing protein [Cumulibacter manganitolerans]
MVETARAARTYGQFCPVAAALDVLGDRWVLLILREMLYGPRRFSEIKQACPGIAPNLLTERLRTLAARGLVAATPSGYELTEAGRGAGPVLRALARFGVDHIDTGHLVTGDPRETGAFRMARGFLQPYQHATLPPMRVRVVAPDASTVDLVKGPADERADLEPSAGTPDVTVALDAEALWLARRDGTPLHCAPQGDPELVEAFLEAFGLQGLVSEN